MSSVNGRAIEDYKRFEVRETGLAVPGAEPLYIPAVSNGYRPDDFIIDSSLVLYLPSHLLKGSKFKSVDRYGHTCSVTGALWRPNHRYFDGSDDLIDCGRDTAFNFGADTDFTLMAWIKCSDVTAYRAIMGKGTSGAGGKRYELYLKQTTGILELTLDDDTNPYAIESASDLSDGVWHLVGGVADRDGNGQIYVDDAANGNAVDISTRLSIDDLNKDLTIGIRSSDESSLDFLGNIGELWIYRRTFSLAEWQHNYKATLWRYQ